MERNECCLVSDFDGVLVDSLPLIDEQVKKIDYLASDEYGRKLKSKLINCQDEIQRLEEEQRFYTKEMLELKKLEAEIQKLRNEHYDHKNIVLEEAYPEVRDKIVYDVVYKIDNAFEGVIEIIHKIWDSGIYERIIVCSSINVGNEIRCKREFVEKYLPMARLVPVRFFFEPYFDPVTREKVKNRIPTDKLKVLLDREGLVDPMKSVVIDDTMGVITQGLGWGFRCYHKKPDDDVCHLFITSANETIDLVHEGKIKKLSR